MHVLQRGLLLVGLASALGFALPAGATGILECGTGCTISASIDGSPVASGYFQIDPATGKISLANDINVAANGGHLWITDVNGNADPILGFAVSASTGGVGNTFSVTFSLPIALSGTILANSSINYSLTGITAPGAQVSPLFGNVLIAQEVDTSIGGLTPLDKGVNAGNTFFCTPGPCNATSPTYTASNSFTGNLAYDLMSITVAFSLSPSSNVGMTGFVQQVVPEPTIVALLGVGLVTLVFARRRTA